MYGNSRFYYMKIVFMCGLNSRLLCVLNVLISLCD